MKKSKLIGLVLAFLLVNALLVTGIFKDHEVATSTLKPSLKFVSGSEGNDAEEVKATNAAMADSDDFITAAISRKIDEKKNTKLGNQPDKKDKTVIEESSLVEEKKPNVQIELDRVPFDISEPEIFESGEVEYADNQILIKFKKSFDGKVSSDLKNAGIGKLDPMFETESGNWYVAYLHKRADVNNTMEAVREMKNVVVAEYNFKSEPASIDTDPLSEAVASNEMVNEQWVLKSCGIQATWDALEEDGIGAGGSSSVTVAVIDTGVDYNHRDLANNIWANVNEIPDNGIDDDGNGYVDDYFGVDMTAKQGSGMDDHGHGTHVAGIIAAENNDTGVVGIAYNAKIMPIKAGDASGYFLQSNIAESIIYAYSHGADVINMSFGGGASSVAVTDALETAYSRCVLVAAAGNSGMPNEPADYYPIPMPSFPADYKYVLGVMSSDSNDIESGFSNWDAKRFNNNEYEVYAPGNEILSTLPGDRYAALSGTSMASPVVAAQAALLRSKFNDPDIYPTKFIYGQISGTAEETVRCCNPQRHTVMGYVHNIPGRVNFESSIKNLPKPELSVSDYTAFDTAGFDTSVEGTAEAATVNNGDGIIDSGEVIALGFTLRNRWGMSKDTVVSINATGSLGVDNPYVTILNNDINYGSVGTYSEQDAGKIVVNDEWTGWDHPFYLKVADNCPNDYTITLNINIESKNALDESDTTVYQGEAAVTLVVRNGVILPNKITEDMTLTADNYYIIPNSTIIMEGATVTVEPGTQIQFWTNDPQDAYADTAIVYLKVQGQFFCKGSEDNPIELFPSDWMGEYRVEIYESDNGYVSLEYTNVANPYINISSANSCVFRQIYPNRDLLYKVLNNGVISTYTNSVQVLVKRAKECAFYKLGGYNEYSKATVGGGKFDTCSFIDSAILFRDNATYTNCLFYGNNNIADGSIGWANSAFDTRPDEGLSPTTDRVIYNADWDRYYVSIYNEYKTYSRNYFSGESYRFIALYSSFASFLNGSLASVGSGKEFSYLTENLIMSDDYWFGQYKGAYGKAFNYDDSEMPTSIPVKNGALNYGCLSQGKITFERTDSSYNNRVLLEVPGNGLAADIGFDKYVVNLETGGSYQIEATIKPATVEQSELVFTSENEEIATVDSNGLINAVSPGTTQIKVWSQDLAIYNYVTVNVTDHVAIEGLSVAENEFQLNIGDTKRIKPIFTPANTTRTAVTYTSSDETIATVSPKGIVTAVSAGDAVITLSGENDLTATVTVHAVIPVESIAFSKDIYETSIEGEEDGRDTIVTVPEILPANATNKNLIWESTDPEVCTVENGSLVKSSTGIVTLRATVENTELSDEITVVVTSNSVNPVAVKTVKWDGSYMYAITEAGEIYFWGNDIKQPQRMAYENVDDAFLNRSEGYVYILNKDKVVKKYSWSIDAPVVDASFGTLNNIVGLSSSNTVTNSYHAIDKYGNAWAWGSNDYGQLGDGSKTYRSTPVQLEFDNKISKIIDVNACTVYMDSLGDIYVSGGNTAIKTPSKLYSGAIDIYTMGYSDYFTIESENTNTGYYTWSFTKQGTYDKRYLNQKYIVNPMVHFYIEEGQPYLRGENDSGQLGLGYAGEILYEYVPMAGVSDVKEFIMFHTRSAFVITNDGDLYGNGYNDNSLLGVDSNDSLVYSPLPVAFLTEDYSTIPLEMTDWSGSSGTVSSDGTIEVTFNMAVKAADDYSLITLTDDTTGEALSISKSIDMNKLKIKPKKELTDCQDPCYTLTIPRTALVSRLNGSLTGDLSLSFAFEHGQSGEQPGDNPEEGEDEEKPDDIEEVHNVVIDQEKMNERPRVTSESLRATWEEYCGQNINAKFYSNVILNRLNDDDTSTWLRITAVNSDSYKTINLGQNYWGTSNEKLINKQILDFDDYQSLADIDESNYLTEPPSDTFPFVTEAYLTVNGGKVDTVGNEEVTFVVGFNRAMDTSIPLEVRFGSSYPYADYTIDGEYVSDTEWQGTVKLTTLIENGYQYFSISNGKAAGTSLKLYKDWGRFPFMIDTASAQSLLMQGRATENGIELEWTQDDFETLAGYNVYRSTAEDGLYTRVNTTVIPADTKFLLDDTVEPGVKYYYNFTVVQTDMTESEPSGKVQITSLDTMAPNIYHTPVTTAYKGSNLVISATIIDNVGIENATLYYRVIGTAEWKSRTMDRNNDKYSAVVNSSYLTDDGLEYYIEAFDGNAYTYKGSAEEPYLVTVQETISASDLGDVDGNGAVELKDAMMLLMAVNDRLNLTEDEFNRADLDGDGELSAKEALKIIMYINGTVSSLR